MPGSWIDQHLPHHAEALRRLIEQHRELEDSPLHLAIAYEPSDRERRHIYLFEVIGMSAHGMSWEENLFEVEYLSSEGFPLEGGEALHLILTNRDELGVALRRGWPLALEVVDAVAAGRFDVLAVDPIGDACLNQIRGAAEGLSVGRA